MQGGNGPDGEHVQVSSVFSSNGLSDHSGRRNPINPCRLIEFDVVGINRRAVSGNIRLHFRLSREIIVKQFFHRVPPIHECGRGREIVAMHESIDRDMIVSESFIQKYATALTTGVFLVVAVTGILLFFHIGNGALKGVHEWLGIAFIAITAIHLMRNWNGFVRLVKKRRTQAVCAVAAIGAAAFIAFAPNDGGSPVARVMGALANAPIENLAPGLGTSTEVLAARLKSKGIVVTTPEQSLTQLVQGQGIDARRLIMALVAEGAGDR